MRAIANPVPFYVYAPGTPASALAIDRAVARPTRRRDDAPTLGLRAPPDFAGC